MTATGFVLNI